MQTRQITEQAQESKSGANQLIIQYALAIGILEFFAYKLLDPYYLQYMTTTRGLNLDPFQFGVFVSLASTINFATNYVTGAFADKIGRRLSWTISLFLYGGGMIWLSFSISSFAFVLPTAVLMGGSYAFYTGAPQAWLYQEVGEDGMRKAFGKLYLYAVPLSTAAVIASVALSVEGSIRLPILVVGAVIALNGLFVLTFKENYGIRKEPWLSVLKDGIKQFTGNRVLWLTATQSFFMTLPMWINSAWWFTYLVTAFQTGLTESALVFGITAVAATAAGMYISRMKTTDYRKLIIYPTLACAVAFFAMPFAPSVILLLISVIVTTTTVYFRGSGITILENEQIASNNRATVLSFLGTLRSAFWVIGPLCWGLLISAIGLKGTFLVAGAVSLISLAILLLALQTARRNETRLN